MARTLEQSLWMYSVPISNGCIEWRGPVNKIGYGVVTFMDGDRRTSTTAHRATWMQRHGPLNRSTYVCHKCDNPLCVNIDHLFVGSQLDNIRDMYAKGRENPRGSRREKRPTTTTRCCANSSSSRTIYSATDISGTEQQMQTEQLNYKQFLERQIISGR